MIIGVKDIQDAFVSVPVRPVRPVRPARITQVEEVVITEPTELTLEEVTLMEGRHQERLLAEEAQTEREADGISE